MEFPIAHNRRAGEPVSSVVPLSARVELYFQRGDRQLYWDTQRNRSRYYNLRDAELAVRW